MNAVTPVFTIPKEQFPSRRFFSLFRQPVNTRLAGAPPALWFFWARNAIFYALRALGISPGAHVLLPAYLCRAAVEPFEVFGTDVEFYPINRDCQPHLDGLEARITMRTEAILVVHYFGFPQQIDKLRALCDRRRLCLIEDCAHVLQGSFDGRPLGTFGDASVFSWRKFLPIYDGGELWLRKPFQGSPPAWQKESLPFTLKVAKSLADKTLENSSGIPAKCFSWALESVKTAAKRLRGKPGDASLFELDSNRATFDDSLVNQKMSRVSRWLKMHSDIPAIVAKRRENFQFLSVHLRGLSGVTLLHAELPDSVCPWIFPIFLNDVQCAHLRLQEQGIPAVNWGGVRPPTVDALVFPDADFLYDNLIFLPVHQDLTPGNLDAIVRGVQKVAVAAALPLEPRVSRFSSIA
jgi:dTDP-4-amino-4,6-dideoxygalactose transaminase